MNTILEWLEGGDQRSDGAASQAADAVLENKQLMPNLAEGLDHPDDLIRGRTMDAFEKIARSRPEWVLAYFPKILELLQKDTVMMVKMHAAMTLGHLAVFKETIPLAAPALLDELDDPSVFTKSWVIVSLCIIARKYPNWHAEILTRIHVLRNDPSVAIRSRVRNALEILMNERLPLPRGWIKSEKIDFP
jgi:hypothetical protein